MERRGIVDVKGKGKMETYFVVGRQVRRPPSFQRQQSHNSSVIAMMYALTQTRRKHTGNTRKFAGIEEYFQSLLNFKILFYFDLKRNTPLRFHYFLENINKKVCFKRKTIKIL